MHSHPLKTSNVPSTRDVIQILNGDAYPKIIYNDDLKSYYKRNFSLDLCKFTLPGDENRVTCAQALHGCRQLVS
jgi:hypothetical protein